MQDAVDDAASVADTASTMGRIVVRPASTIRIIMPGILIVFAPTNFEPHDSYGPTLAWAKWIESPGTMLRIVVAVFYRVRAGSYGAVMALPVLLLNIKIVYCCLCGESCLAESPFSDAQDDDPYGGHWPWRRYTMAPDEEHKVPHASCCLICWRVFKILGLDIKFKNSIPKYLASLKATADGLGPFLKSHRSYIKHVNDNGDGSRALLNKAVIEAKVTVTSSERQGTRAISRRTFILEKVFMDTYAQDFVALPDKDVFHVNKKLGSQSGFWLPGAVNVHLPGHFEFEDYEDVGVEFSRLHEVTRASRAVVVWRTDTNQVLGGPICSRPFGILFFVAAHRVFELIVHTKPLAPLVSFSTSLLEL
jgi:hypothetical protein